MVNMRLALDPRAQRMLRRIPRSSAFSIFELILLFLLAVQIARLIWAIVTPVDPIGAWRPGTGSGAAIPSADVLHTFDPFFRQSADTASAPVVTALNLKLYGVRTDAVSGRGSAIIGLPDGTQASYAVGDEIMPGVTLAAVAADGVTISRGGAKEQIYLDQSQDTPLIPGPPDASSTSAPPPIPSGGPPAGNPLTSDIVTTPRLEGGRVTGITVQPRGPNGPFQSSGLMKDDVIVSIDGQPVQDGDLSGALSHGAPDRKTISVTVQRAGQPVNVQLRTGQ